MNEKIIGIFICALLIATAIPTVGIMNKVKDNLRSSALFNGEEWNMTFGGTGFDEFRSVQATNDRGYIACGRVDGNSVWIVKVDSTGNLEWETIRPNDYGGIICGALNVEETSDSGYILCVIYNHETDWYIGGLLKIDSSGVIEWEQLYYDLDAEWSCTPRTTIELDDGYITAGTIGYEPGVEDIGKDSDVTLIKTDLSGNLLWKQIYRYGDGNEHGFSLCPTTDGGYLTGGYAEVEGKLLDFWMIKIESNGNMEWNKTFGGPKYDKGYYGWLQTNNGDYMMCGYTDSYGAGREDLWIVKTDASGNMLWNKTFGEKTRDLFNEMDSTSDGGYVFCGTKNAGGFSGNKDDIWVIKTDSDGNAESSQTFGGSKGEWGWSVSKTSDGGCIVAGYTKSKGSGNADGWLIKLSSFENQRPEKPTIDGPDSGKPDKEYTFTASCTDPNGDSLSYMWDWGEGNYSDWLDTNKATYSWTDEDRFEIRVMAIDEHGGESEWSEPFLFTTPRNKHASTLFLSFFETHPNMFPILQLLLQRLGLQ